MIPLQKGTLTLAILLSALMGLATKVVTGQFKSADEALKKLDGMGECKCDIDIVAYKYFAAHKDESIPVLLGFAASNPQRLFVVVKAISKIKDDRSFFFLQDLLNRPSETRGQISQLELILTLGDYGDPRAVTSLKPFQETDDIGIRDSTKEALCKLGDVTLNEFAIYLDGDREKIRKVVRSNIYGTPSFAIKVIDWMIQNSSKGDEDVYLLHIDKAQALLNMEDYPDLAKEIDFIFKNFPDRAKGQDLSIGHLGVPLGKAVEEGKHRVYLY